MKYQKFWSKSFVLFLMAMLGFGISAPSAIATDVSPSVSPVKTVISANPGEKKQIPIVLKNNSTSTMLIKSVFNDFTSSADNTGEPKVLSDGSKDPHGISSWLSGIVQMPLKAGATSTYLITVTIPANTPGGTYYGVARFNDTSNGGSTSSVGSLIFVNVGKMEPVVFITEIDTSEVTFSVDGNVSGTISTQIKNTSNYYTVPKVSAQLQGDDKSAIETLDLNSDSGGILPGGTRTFSKKVDAKADPTKDYNFVATATLENDKTVTKTELLKAAVSPTPKSTPSTAKKNSNVQYAILSVVGITAAIIFILFFLVRRKRKQVVPVPPLPLTDPILNPSVQTSIPTVIQPNVIHTIIPTATINTPVRNDILPSEGKDPNQTGDPLPRNN